MPNSNYIHLHLHTMYSMLDGLGKIDEIMERCKECGMDAVAITDHGVLHGIIDFYKTAKDHDIKPIIGMEAYVVGDRTGDSRANYHMVLLAKNQVGYKNLIEIASDAGTTGKYYGKHRTDIRVLREHGEGIIATSACLGGEIPKLLEEDEFEQAVDMAKEYDRIFDEFYLEIQPHNYMDQIKLNYKIMELHKATGIPVIMASDAHYVQPNHSESHDVLLAVQTGAKMSDEDRFSFSSDTYWMQSEEEVREMMSEYADEEMMEIMEEAIMNTKRVADACNVEIEFGNRLLPEFESPKGEPEEYLRELCEAELVRHALENDIDYDEYYERLNYELSIINPTGVAPYFLIVRDYIMYARKNGIAVGPGRGSAAGSLVSYLIGITDIDPIPYGLLFERFLTEGRARVSMPDIDTDFANDDRDKVIEYLIEKYGEDHVAHIGTFNELGAKSALKDVARVLEIPFKEANDITSAIPDKAVDDDGEEVRDFDIDDALLYSEELREYEKKYPELFAHAKRIEGVPRQSSVHACGILVSPVSIPENIPLMSGKDDKYFAPIIQFDGEQVEELGFLKFDILGLKTLSVITNTLKAIPRDKRPNLRKIPLDDPKVYEEVYQTAKTLGVFQVESNIFRDRLRKIQPERFDDIIDILALVRPGPMDSGQDMVYINNRHSATGVQYEHPVLQEYYDETHGILLYQEQIIIMAQELAGYSPEGADKLRKGVGKKKQDVIDREKPKFIQGMKDNGYEENFAKELWDQIETFARYGFNKSHSAAYGKISYWTAYLKHYFPTEFMAAVMSNDASDQDKVNDAMREARRLGIKILPPDVNESELGFTVAGNKQIRYGLEGIKGIGPAAVSQIMKVRPVKSLKDFYERADKRKIHKGVMSKLIKVGALDCFDKNRKALLQQYFELREEPEVFIEEYKNLNFTKQEKFAWEKELIGMYITGHPFDEFDLPGWKDAPLNSKIDCVGTVVRKKQIVTRNGNDMAFIDIETREGVLNVVIFPSQFSNVVKRDDDGKIISSKIDKGSIVRIKGKKEINSRNDELQVIANYITNPRMPESEVIQGSTGRLEDF